MDKFEIYKILKENKDEEYKELFTQIIERKLSITIDDIREQIKLNKLAKLELDKREAEGNLERIEYRIKEVK